MSESPLMARIRIEMSKLGARLFRNQVGRYKLEDGRYIRSGLCIGSSDLIGWLPVTVTPAMVGHRISVFVAVETKSKRGKLTTEQAAFLKTVESAGGYALVARDVESVTKTLSQP